MPTRIKHSKLDRPKIVTYLRRQAVARLKAVDKRPYSLQQLSKKIGERFGTKVHKSTIHRFLKDLGINFAWEKTA
jgi:transposase